MKLIKKQVEREGNTYTDFYLAWQYNNKLYAVRVRPVFGRDNDKLHSVAQEVCGEEPFEKYL